MQNIEKIRKVLTFCGLANKLKTAVIDINNNYSVADYLFDEMILTIAMDSEFKETNDLPKLLRMMFLEGFTIVNPYYLISDLKKGPQFKDEINEVRDLKSKYAKLIFKYGTLSFDLNSLIQEQGNSLEYSDLVKESMKIFKPKNADEYSKYENVFRFFYLNSKLKNKIRSGWDSKHWNIKAPRVERISEHVIGSIAFAIVMDSEMGYKDVDIDKVIKMLAIHEIGEIIIGDITPFDGITAEQKAEQEHKAMLDVIGNLTAKEELMADLLAFDAHLSNTTTFAHFCDKMDADYEAKIYQDRGYQRDLDDQENNCILKNPRVQQMLKDGAKNAFDIWYAYDIDIYKDNKTFPEFAQMLKVIKDNNILEINSGPIKQKVNLSMDEYHYIVETLGKIAKSFFQDNKIDCVYLTTCQREGADNGVIKLVILLKNNASCADYKTLIARMNEEFAQSNQTSVVVEFAGGYVADYSLMALNPSEIYRVEGLNDASIIFDKSGRISKLKDKMKLYSPIYPCYVMDYEPAIAEPLIHKLKKEA